MDERPYAHVVSISGGKDSTALALVCREMIDAGMVPPGRIILAFAETDNEHPITYDYLAYLEDALQMPIVRLRADFAQRIERKRAYVAEHWPKEGIAAEVVERALAALVPTGIAMLDLCIWKGRFPSRRAQFCTQELKTVPLQNFQLDLVDEGCCVWSWQGIRADESPNRRYAPIFEEIGDHLFVYRPILRWPAQATFEAMAISGVRPNPLYTQGMKRVGCMPCINCGKSELSEIAQRWPEVIDRIASWESAVAAASKRGAPSFFPAPEDGRADLQGRNIQERLQWARTTRGGLQFDLLADLPPARCESFYQLCE